MVLGIVGPLVERGCWQYYYYYYYSDGGIEIENVDVAIFLQNDDVDETAGCMDHSANLDMDHAAAVVDEAAVRDQDPMPDFGHIYAGDYLHLKLDIAPYCLTDGHDIAEVVPLLFFVVCALAPPSSLAFDEVATAAALFALAAAPRVSS